MSLNELWFLLIAVLFVGFFFLEGFDFGVGMASRFISKNDTDRRVMINTIGPFWDANEVWFITAAGAMFAAFPHWYATMFSGFYIPFTLLLLVLIARGVAFEFRSKLTAPAWRKVWDMCILLGSMLPPLFLGIVFAAMIRGLPIGSDMEMHAGILDVFNPYTIMAGIALTVLCYLHGLNFLTLRTDGVIRERAGRAARKLLPIQAVLLVILVVWTYAATDIFDRRGLLLMIAVALGAGSVLLMGYMMKHKREGWAFGLSGFLIILTIASFFIGLFPRVMISSIDHIYDLTLMNAASGPYTLKTMTIVSLIILPFVLGYQAWSYFVFHKRVSSKDHLEY